MNNKQAKEGIIASIVLLIYGIFMFLIGIFSGKKKSEADILGKVLDRSDELKKEIKEVCPFDENLSEEEAKEYYINLPEEEKEKFRKDLDEWYITIQKEKELLTFAKQI